MPRLIWTARATADLERLHDFVAVKNRIAALRAVMCIHAALEQLLTFPLSGRQTDSARQRELVIPFGASAYRVLYDVSEEVVRVLAVRHGRELSP